MAYSFGERECPDGGPASGCAECVAERRLDRVARALGRRVARLRSRLRRAAADVADYCDAYALASLAAMCLPGVAVYWKDDTVPMAEQADDALYIASRILEQAKAKVRR